ncbi:DUF397 domain-containing protein [Streptomyces sp. NBC_00191]|uniref:DUF397 domain-containing protein n=1 Tax=Streptomyces sp. NBC_00191 TaxID=2975674 RepID=UPI00324D20C2
MDASPEFEFVGVSACRPRSGVNNCPEIARNVQGVVALRDTEQPDIIVTMTEDGWAGLTAAVKAGEFD